jgi:hypothetical protein
MDSVVGPNFSSASESAQERPAERDAHGRAGDEEDRVHLAVWIEDGGKQEAGESAGESGEHDLDGDDEGPSRAAM